MFKLFNDDCMVIMDKLIENNIQFDFIFADLPYQETGNKWDKKIDLIEMFNKLKKLSKDSTAIAFTGTFKFGVQLFNACPELYKYDWVWEKDNGTNVPSVNYQPFRVHENIYIFGKGRVSNGNKTPMKYNPQKTEGVSYCQKSGKKSSDYKGGLNNIVTDNPTGLRHPKTIQKFVRDKGLHPTQKPLSMMEYLVKTYSDEGDLVLDFTMGSGTTGVACKLNNRNFIGIEINREYFNIAKERIENCDKVI